MNLRRELQYPKLDTSLIKRLESIAEEIDGKDLSKECQQEINIFNELAGTGLTWRDFQGVYGGIGHIEWVKSLLVTDNYMLPENIDYHELLEICKRTTSPDKYSEAETAYYLRLLDRYIPGSHISDLIYWPNKWFNDESWPEMKPEEILDWALATQPRLRFKLPDGKKLPTLPKSKENDPPAIICL